MEMNFHTVDEECPSEVVVDVRFIMTLRMIGLTLIFLGNYLFLRDVRYYDTDSLAILFALPFAALGAFMLVLTYLVADKHYAPFAHLSFVLELLASFIYFSQTSVRTQFQDENSVYIMILIGQIIAILLVFTSESRLSSHRIVPFLFGTVFACFLFYFMMIKPYFVEYFTDRQGFVFNSYAGLTIDEMLADPIGKRNFYIAMAGLGGMVALIIGVLIWAKRTGTEITAQAAGEVGYKKMLCPFSRSSIIYLLLLYVLI